jgi:hypothetical protein
LALASHLIRQRKEDDHVKRGFRLTNSLLRDRLRALAAEYSVTVDLLINLAVKRLLDDVETLRTLRAGKVK